MNKNFLGKEEELVRVFPLTKKGLFHKKDLNRIVERYSVSEDFLTFYLENGYITNTLAVARNQDVSESFLTKNIQYFERYELSWACQYQEVSAEFVIKHSHIIERAVEKNEKMKEEEKEAVRTYLKLKSIFA